MRGIKKILLTGLACLAIITQARAEEPRWAIGCWDCRSWGAIRLLDDRYAIDLDPEGKLQNWGVWQYNTSRDRVLIVWMESSMVEFIERENGKFYRQSFYPFGASSKLEETKKIGK